MRESLGEAIQSSLLFEMLLWRKENDDTNR